MAPIILKARRCRDAARSKAELARLELERCLVEVERAEAYLLLAETLGKELTALEAFGPHAADVGSRA